MFEYRYTDENGRDIYQDPDRPELGDHAQTGEIDGLPYMEPVEQD